MALSAQAVDGVDAGLKAKVKVVLARKALSVAKAGSKGSDQANADEIRLAAAVLKDLDGWATIATFAAASIANEALGNASMTPTITAASTDAQIRDALIIGANSVWQSLAGTV